MEAYDNRGLPYADNDTNFKQNLIRTSKTEELGWLEEFRHKEMTDAFITDDEAEYCIRTLEVVQNNIEIHHEIISKYLDHLLKINRTRKMQGLKLISLEKEFLKYKKGCLMPTIQRDMSRIKNICQISKSRNGIGVKTLTTQQTVMVSHAENRNFEPEKPKSIFGFLQPKPKQDPNKPVERGGNPYG